MSTKILKLAGLAYLFTFALALAGCRGGGAISTTKQPPPPLPPAQLLPSDAEVDQQTIRFLEARINRPGRFHRRQQAC